jgi:site-specific DNA-methyltransferase (adenine-specific)
MPPMYELIHGDCLEVLPSMPSKSIDCIIADPPYGTTACKWDSVIPLAPMWEQLKRVIKPSGAIVLFAGQPFTSALVMSNPKWFKYAWVWDKRLGVGFQVAKYRPMMRHEDILIFSNGTPNYHPIMVKRDKPRMVGGYGAGKSPTSPLAYQDGEKRISTHAYPTSIIEVSNAKRSGSIHPTQKPVDLMRYLVRTYTQSGEEILDFTAGSGSTGVAALLEGRRFIGIEKDQHYYEVARQRLEEAAGSSANARVQAQQPSLLEGLPYAD